jgi:hypothetical protein
LTATSSRSGKSDRPPIGENLVYQSQKRTVEEKVGEMLENISLNNMPLEERRKEARKPLFLIRYE